MTTPALRLEHVGAVANIVIDRPEKKNSLTVEQMGQVGSLVEQAVAEGARCIVIKGAADVFSAGRDLQGVDAQNEDTVAIIRDVINPSLAKVRDCAVPTIACVKGPALGFGFGLALACDITYVADNALMGSPFRNIGLILDSGGHFYLKERVGAHRAAEIIFTGKMFSGKEAAKMGLVNRSLGATDLENYVQSVAKSIATGPTAAFAATKTILASAEGYDAMAALESHYQAKLIRGEDGTEGIRAFQEKRKPKFVGR